jgi:hypothetical protein
MEKCLKIPNGHKIYRSIKLQDLPKYIKNYNFVLKIFQLATLPGTRVTG